MPGEAAARLVKRSMSLAGHRTSIALEPAFWVAIERLAGRGGETVAQLVARIDAGRAPVQPLASALRLVALHHAGSAQNGDDR